MDLLFTREQEAIVEAVGKYLSTACPLERLHTADRPGMAVPSFATEEYWGGLADIGIFELGLPEAVGGAGLGIADEVAVFREVGRTVAPGPVLGTVLAAHAAAAAQAGGLLDELVAGRTRAALGFTRAGQALSWGSMMSGGARVHDLDTADWVLLVDTNSVALIRAADVSVLQVDAVDPTAPVSVVSVHGAPEFVLHDAGALVRRGRLLLASMLCGNSEATRDDSAAYAKTREQFGKPIGAFQGVKHRCAEMAVRSEVAFFQTVYGALVCDEGLPQPDFHASSALVMARDAAALNSADNVQNHGGIGFTAEADAHLFLRRQISLRFAFGSNRLNLETVAQAETMP